MCNFWKEIRKFLQDYQDLRFKNIFEPRAKLIKTLPDKPNLFLNHMLVDSSNRPLHPCTKKTLHHLRLVILGSVCHFGIHQLNQTIHLCLSIRFYVHQSVVYKKENI